MEDNMIKTVIFAVSGALIAAASPALADTGRAPAEPTTSANTAGSGGKAATKSAASQRYCVKETNLDSRIPRRTCQTRDEWLAQGFDPLAKK
jgi:hypothetical protein